MNLSLSDVLFVGLIIVIIACGLAGLGELRDWFDEARQLDRVRRLAALDQAARTTVAREQAPIGQLVVVNPAVEALATCLWCTPGVPVSIAEPADCTCRRRCTATYCAPQRQAERGLA